MITAMLLPVFSAAAQSSPPGDSSPYGNARIMKDIPYTAHPHPRQTLDLYLPKDKAQGPATLIVWMHGGAWMLSNKDWNNVKYLVKHGYALASVDYRLSDDARFPAQIQDCNTALNFLLANASTYGFSPNHFAVGGASAGGHLALLLGLARNERALARTHPSNRLPSSISSGRRTSPPCWTKRKVTATRCRTTLCGACLGRR